MSTKEPTIPLTPPPAPPKRKAPKDQRPYYQRDPLERVMVKK